MVGREAEAEHEREEGERVERRRGKRVENGVEEEGVVEVERGIGWGEEEGRGGSGGDRTEESGGGCKTSEDEEVAVEAGFEEKGEGLEKPREGGGGLEEGEALLLGGAARVWG